MDSNKRNSTMEVLRIISMWCVLVLHYLNSQIGGGMKGTQIFNVITTRGIESICISFVNVFVLISGYYLSSRNRKKSTSLKKCIDLYLVMVFYNLLFYGVAVLLGRDSFSLKTIFFAVFPWAEDRRWFVKAYIIMVVLSPFMIMLCESITKKQHQFLLIILLFLFSFWPSFLVKPPISDRGYGFVHFITLFMIANYIRRYVYKAYLVMMRKRLVIGFVGSIIIIFLTRFIPKIGSRAWNYNYLFCITAAICVFLFFLGLPEKQNQRIDNLAATTFGIYLIHSVLYIQTLVYHDLMKTHLFINSYLQPLHLIVAVTLQFCICALFDFLRSQIWSRTVYKWISDSSLLEKEEGFERSIFGQDRY